MNTFYPAICIPHRNNSVPTKFSYSLCQMQKPEKYELLTMSRTFSDVALNAMIEDALAKGCTHILSLDDDMIFPAQTLYQLAEHDVDIVGGLYFMRVPPHDANMFRYNKEGFLCKVNNYWRHGLQSCEATGTGCLLIKANVFDTMPKPWFIWNEQVEWIKNIVHPTKDTSFITYDVSFCLRARKLGFPVYCDTDLICTHLGEEIEINEKTLEYL